MVILRLGQQLWLEHSKLMHLAHQFEFLEYTPNLFQNLSFPYLMFFYSGYMAPEYALFGNVSPKIDVFSFGVLVLEIITGRRNNSSSDESDKSVNLLTDVSSILISPKAVY